MATKDQLSPEDAERILFLAKELNEISRQIMAAAMSSRAMVYDERCFKLLRKNLDYNSVEMLDYLIGKNGIDT